MPEAFSREESVLCFHGPLLYRARILDVEHSGSSASYFVHYLGWKSKWNEWVEGDRIKPISDETLLLQKSLKDQHRSSAGLEAPAAKAPKKERVPSLAEAPELSLPLPDALLDVLRMDHRMVCKNKRLCDVPLRHSASEILCEYGRERGPAAGLVEDLLEYFNAAFGMMLLYRFERQQYSDLLHSAGEAAFVPAEVYGLPHLLRLLVKLPSILQSVLEGPLSPPVHSQLEAALGDVVAFLSERHAAYCTAADYVCAPPQYRSQVSK